MDTAEQVKANWDEIKRGERGSVETSSLEGVPEGMPGLERAAKLQRKAADVGFDWPERGPVVDKVAEEVEEIRQALNDPIAAEAELGDLLFSVVNLARHLKVDPELALRGAINRFVERFQAMEQMGPLVGLSLEELDSRWEIAKLVVRRET